MEEDHQILGAGGPLGQCSRKLISNPDFIPNDSNVICYLNRLKTSVYVHWLAESFTTQF